MSNKKIKAGAVSYLNAFPLLYGFEKGAMQDKLEIIRDFPSAIAEKLLNDTIDLGLVPIAIIPLLKSYHIVTEYCIGCDGEVASVCLFSDVPIEEIESVYLDYQSNTSVALLKILLKELWNTSPQLIDANPGYEKNISGKRAGLIIGDRSFIQRNTSVYCYDLGEAWKTLTGMPFVFAAWISNKKLPETFCTEFNTATGAGLKHIKKIVSENPYPLFDLEHYYSQIIKFRLNVQMRASIALFLSKLNSST